jgi:alkylated DNA repair dioxygenase AlkB
MANLLQQYHQDGEKELGPTVASIPLGCPAEMCFRLSEEGWKWKDFEAVPQVDALSWRHNDDLDFVPRKAWKG